MMRPRRPVYQVRGTGGSQGEVSLKMVRPSIYCRRAARTPCPVSRVETTTTTTTPRE